MLEEEIVQDTIDANKDRMIKLADKKGAINKKKKDSDARVAKIENRRIKKSF